jgi:7-keto-8-aminopelargonate synthetase-like enzyme/acyl-CoA synthetase (AMP-forming)/AMP-acid ligase II/alkanesulfonate monooxygenase SsuD/methylene tetrahydromethanopterin reductase-like flavin-dependent oxidoreductase (luciferase family)
MGDGAVTLVDVLVARAHETPDKPAYTYLTGETLDYGELYRRAAGVATTVAATGAPGDRVLVPSVFGPPFATAFFGCLLASRVPVPVANPTGAAGTAAFAALAADCAATAVLAPAELRLDHPLTRLASDVPAEPITAPVLPAGDDIALLQYTSGSTRSPRGVVVSHANLMHNLDAIARAFGTAPDHRGVFWLPPHHDMGLVGGLLAAVHTGCPVTLMSPTAFLRDPLAWLRAIAANGRVVSGGPTFCYDHTARKIAPADVEGLDLSGWDVAFVGAEPVNPAVLDRFARHFAPAGFRQESFLPCYGMAEATLLVSATRAGDGVRTADGVVSCGRPADTIAVVGEDGHRVPAGETGEIWVSGRSVARGYWRDSGPAVFGATLPGEPGPYLRTGDLGFERDGELYVAGRRKELIVLRGRNIVPQDVEWSVEAGHPGLRGCAAVGVTVAGEERLAVLVEADRRTARADLETSVRHVVSRDHGIDVHRVVVLRPGQLPRTTSGKLQRGKAAALAGGDTVDRVVTWLADHLGVPEGTLDAGQPLTSLGLDSVKAAELTTYVERMFGHTIPAERLFDGLTIAELAADLGAPRVPAPARVATTRLQLSLFCFAHDTDAGKHALFLECARYADRQGFHAIWAPERDFPRFGGPFPTPAVLGAALATTTTRLRIRTGNVVQPGRDAVCAAQEWSVVDNLADGRVDLAFAAEHQHELLAAARKVRHLWRGAPWLLCDGRSDRFAQAGAAGANVLAPLLFQDIGKLATKIAAYRNARAARGHDAGHVTVVVDLRASAGSTDAVAARIERLAEAGVDELACLVDLGSPREDVLAELAHLAELVPAPPAHRDVFRQARDFTRARELAEAGLMPFYPSLGATDGATVEHAGRQLILLGANNYLGLTADNRVRGATAAAALADGPSGTGSRLMNGSTTAQRDLERALARFLGRADALLFATGYQANIGLLSAFMGKGTVLVADEECHASVYDGVAVGGGRTVRFRHNDVADLDHKLTTEVAGAPAMVMVDGVYSMSGDLAPLSAIRAVCDRHGVPLAVDDAHGLGTTGATGRGVEEELDVPGCADVLTGTLSKSLASVGGFLAGPAELVDWVRFHGRSMLFSAAIPPPAVAAAATALAVLAAEPERVSKLRELAAYWRAGLSALGYDTGASGSAVVPVLVGDELTCLRFARSLLDGGVYANCVLAPAVPAGRALIRTAVSAVHEKQHLDRALEVFHAVGRELGVIPG